MLPNILQCTEHSSPLNDKKLSSPKCQQSQGQKRWSEVKVTCSILQEWSPDMDQNLLTKSWDQLETQFHYLAITALLGLSHICGLLG